MLTTNYSYNALSTSNPYRQVQNAWKTRSIVNDVYPNLRFFHSYHARAKIHITPFERDVTSLNRLARPSKQDRSPSGFFLASTFLPHPFPYSPSKVYLHCLTSQKSNKPLPSTITSHVAVGCVSVARQASYTA